MTDWRKRMTEDLYLRGMSDSTVDMYVRAVRLLSEHYQKEPDQISEEELRQYFLYNKNHRNWSRTTSTIALCGIKFFYTYSLQREWTTLRFVRPEKVKTLPVVLSQNQVHKIMSKVRFFHHQACLFTIYSLGLRLQEGNHLYPVR
jgi:site-specific recombinase XerD